jgi:hypothetical protein
LLILVGYLGLVRLAAGEPPSGAFLPQTVDRTVGIVALALRLLS